MMSSNFLLLKFGLHFFLLHQGHLERCEQVLSKYMFIIHKTILFIVSVTRVSAIPFKEALDTLLRSDSIANEL